MATVDLSAFAEFAVDAPSPVSLLIPCWLREPAKRETEVLCLVSDPISSRYSVHFYVSKLPCSKPIQPEWSRKVNVSIIGTCIPLIPRQPSSSCATHPNGESQHPITLQYRS